MSAGTVVFVVSQRGVPGDGGLHSVGRIVEQLNDWNVEVVTNLDSRYTEDWKETAKKVNVIPYTTTGFTRLKSWRDFVKCNLRMWAYVNREQIPLVHTNDRIAFWLFGLGAKLAGASVVDNIRGTQFELAGMRRIRWLFELAISDRIVVLSREMETELINSLRAGGGLWVNIGKLEDKITPIYSIVDMERFKPSSGEARGGSTECDIGMACSGNMKVLLYVGAFRRLKGQKEFLQYCVPSLVEKGCTFKVVFVGYCRPEENKYARECIEVVGSLSLEEYVELVGYKESIEEYYRIADITVVGSKMEGLPRAMIESLACGTMVVSFDVSSAREVLEEWECGIVVEQGKYDKLARVIDGVLRDSELRLSMEKRAVGVARKLFESENVIREYKVVYEEVTV